MEARSLFLNMSGIWFPLPCATHTRIPELQVVSDTDSPGPLPFFISMLLLVGRYQHWGTNSLLSLFWGNLINVKWPSSILFLWCLSNKTRGRFSDMLKSSTTSGSFSCIGFVIRSNKNYLLLLSGQMVCSILSLFNCLIISCFHLSFFKCSRPCLLCQEITTRISYWDF